MVKFFSATYIFSTRKHTSSSNDIDCLSLSEAAMQIVVEGLVKHFPLAEWADFVRGVVTAEKKGSMQKHLDQNCSDCKKTVEMWTSIVELSRHAIAYEPPLSALRIAESYLIPFKLALPQAHALQLARPVFDSFESPALEGVRGLDTVPQQLMYQCGDFFIDVRLEPKPASNSMVLAGQVVDSRKPGSGLAGIPVSLFGKGHSLFETATNQLGEFHFSFQAEQRLRLLFDMEETALLVLLPDAEFGTA
jgi:hypothetical protein